MLLAFMTHTVSTTQRCNDLYVCTTSNTLQPSSVVAMSAFRVKNVWRSSCLVRDILKHSWEGFTEYNKQPGGLYDNFFCCFFAFESWRLNTHTFGWTFVIHCRCHRLFSVSPQLFFCHKDILRTEGLLSFVFISILANRPYACGKLP